MSFSIQISSDLVSVEAGETTPINLQVINRGDEVDRYELEVEGLDPEWTAVPVAIFTIGPSETQTEKIFFKPGRASESLAGNYPFVVKVRSLNSGDSRQVQGVVQIKPYNHLSMEIIPKKGAVTPIRTAEIFHACIMNLGNTEQTLQLYGSDTEDSFAFEFAQEQVTVGPGQQKEVQIRATPTNSRPFANPRLYVFTISARSIQTPSLVATAQAQIEQRPIITPTTIGVALVVFLLGLGWYLSRPQPPSLDALRLDPTRDSYELNDIVTVTWHASHASGVRITLPGKEDPVNEGPSGSMTISATQSGSVEAVAVEGKSVSKPVTVSFEVTQPPVVPPPTIDSFDISPREVDVGQPFEVHYKVSNAVRVLLEPTATVLDLLADVYEIKPDQPGTTKYWLVAESATNKAVKSREISVKVSQSSQAHIVFFEVQPRNVDPTDNSVTVQWQTTNAARIVLSVGGVTTDLQQTSGQETFPLDENTEIYLTAYDANGIIVRSKRIVVKYSEPPPPVPPTTGGGGNTTSTTGNNNPPSTTSTGGGE